jgi:hypothetical protein
MIEAGSPARVSSEGPHLYLEGLALMGGGKVNANGRAYPTHVLDNAVNKVSNRIASYAERD